MEIWKVKGGLFSIQIHRLLEFCPQEPQGFAPPPAAETEGLSQVASLVAVSRKPSEEVIV